MSLGSLWDSFTGLFSSKPSSTVSVLSPIPEEQTQHSQTMLSSNPSQAELAGSFLDPSGGMITQQSPGFFGSLWDGLTKTTSAVTGAVKGVWGEVKEVAPTAVQLYKEVKSAGADSLSLVMPTTKPPSPNYQLSTPYQRASSGATPAVISTAGGGGLPLPLILAGAAVVVLLFMKGKKK